MTRRYRALTALALIATLAVSGCQGGSNESSANTGDRPMDEITYITAFGAVGRDAFAWVGVEKGFFRDAGINMKIQLGAGTEPNLKAISSGQAQFGSLDLTGVIISAGKGAYTDVVGFASVQQQTLVSIMAPEGSGITTPKDLVGKRLGAATGSVNQLLFPAYARLAGFDGDSVKIQNLQNTALGQALGSGQIDALSTFLISKAGIEKAANKKVIVMPYSDYLKDLFGNSLITTKKIANENPDLTKRFRDAALKALQYTIDHPEEAAEIMHKAQPAALVDAAIGEIKLMTPYLTTGGSALGALDEGRVAQSISILEGAGLIPAGLKPDSVVDFDLTPKV
jgi:NitT/TauT family transport system substrate-binding protein